MREQQRPSERKQQTLGRRTYGPPRLSNLGSISLLTLTGSGTITDMNGPNGSMP